MTWDVKVKKWHGVASWTWDAGDDVCGICRMPFDGCPPDGEQPMHNDAGISFTRKDAKLQPTFILCAL